MPRAKRETSNESIDSEKLDKYGERFESLSTELKSAQEAVKDLMSEMKSNGFNTKQFRKAMKVKEIGYDEYRVEDEEFKLYLKGVGAMPKFETTY